MAQINNVFLCGLGINGKSSILRKLVDNYKLENVRFSTTSEYIRLQRMFDIPDNGKNILLMKYARYSEIRNCFVDRSFLDQVLINNFLYEGYGYLEKDVEFEINYEMLDRFMEGLKGTHENSKFILLNTIGKTFVERVIHSHEFLRSDRASIYRTVDEYRFAEKYFHDNFVRICKRYALQYESIDLKWIDDRVINSLAKTAISKWRPTEV